MAFTYGFYNSLNGDRRYTAEEFGSIFDGIIMDGFFGNFAKGMLAKASEYSNKLIVQPGRAWFDHTWCLVDSDTLVEIPTDSRTTPNAVKCDTLVIEVNKTTRTNSLEWVTGEWLYSSTEDWTIAEKPIIYQEAYINRHPICTVYRVSSNANAIASIENEIGASEYSKLIKPPTEYLSSEDILNTWNSAFNQWNEDKQAAFISWMAEQQQNFIDWWDGLRLVIDENVAGHLQNEIEDLDDKIGDIKVIPQSTTLPDGTHKEIKYLSVDGVTPMPNGAIPGSTRYVKQFTLRSGSYSTVEIEDPDPDSFDDFTAIEVFTDQQDLSYVDIITSSSEHTCRITYFGKYSDDRTVTVFVYANK